MMTHGDNLPWELTEEILSCVPPKSLVRFRAVSKQWNALFHDKTFINNHKSTFRFILKTKSKIYSVSIDPKIVVRELTLDIPGLESQIPNDVVDCDAFLLCGMDKGAAVWNPWLNRATWFEAEVSQPKLRIDGIGYDSNKRSHENVYKTVWYRPRISVLEHTTWKIHDYASDAWNEVVSESGGGDEQGRKRPTLHSKSSVSLNGTLYWVTYVEETDPASYFLSKLDLSTEKFLRFCDLPFGMNHPRNALVLRVFKGDRFSLLTQCYVTKKIEVWVTKNKINHEDDVVWMSLMTFSDPDLPSLVETISYSQPSYFVDDKRLVVCSCDENGRAWVYVMGENKLISKTRIDSVVDKWPTHCTYFPSLAPIPRSQRQKRKRDESEEEA
ncbi:unnamed protein product [Microthlaspi erraticum]|uniref:F-box domain-containing protein n=1 Tax=Microthlaspi erraticum TaxID=1685480 RepID=A0A6D2KJP9_9BRAS|nr:unnamed protein product [Microthlaspi erraticum]